MTILIVGWCKRNETILYAHLTNGLLRIFFPRKDAHFTLLPRIDYIGYRQKVYGMALRTKNPGSNYINSSLD